MFYLTREEIKQIIYGIMCAPLIFAVVWFYCAVGTVWEEQIRCNNGAVQFCGK